MENKNEIHLSIASGLIILVAAMLACNAPISKPSSDITCYDGITLGQTSREDVIALLGNPERTEQNGGVEILLYPSLHPGQFNIIFIQDQVVVLIDMLLGDEDAPAFSEIKSIYGEPSHIAYTTFMQGSMSYIYPDAGRAFIADENADIVFTKQCFLPMSLEDYLNTWGKDLPTENPFTQ
jgi:hypothetical protein